MGASLFFDPGLNEVVMFGGYNGSTYLSDTWAFNGSVWSLVTLTGTAPSNAPSARYFASAAGYDSGHEVLFGGSNNGTTSSGFDADTWVFAGTSGGGGTWSPVTTGPTPPSKRQGASMVYDPVRGQAVLFGGYGAAGYLADTWTYTASGWAQPTQNASFPSPPARIWASAAFDSSAGTMVLEGGFTGSTYLNDTWRWDGTDWSQATGIASPSGRMLATMSYDPTTEQLVLASGNSGSAFLGDTWSASHRAATLSVTAPTSGTLSRGEAASYVLDVGDPGPAPLLIRLVTDELPAGFSPQAITFGSTTVPCTKLTSPSCTVDGRYVFMNSFSMPSNTDQKFTVTGIVEGATEGTGANACSSTASYTSAVAGGSAYRDAIVNDPITHAESYYRLGEGTGTAAADATGHGNTASYVGGVSLGQPGAPIGDTDTSVTLNGSSGYVSLPASSLLPLAANGLDVELWVNPSSITNNGTLFDASASATANTSAVWLHRVGTTDGLELEFDNANGQSPALIVPNALLKNTWQLIQVKFSPNGQNAANQDIEIDRDGAYLGASTITGPDAVSRPFAALGATPAGSYFAGGLDEAVLYQNPTYLVPSHFDVADSAVNGVDVATVANPVSSSYRNVIAADTAFFYRLGESGPAVAQDSGGSGASGNYEGTISYGVTGPVANEPVTAVSLGSSSPSDINLSPSITGLPFNTTALSIEAWVKPTAGSATGAIVSIGNASVGSGVAMDSLQLTENPANGALGWSSNGGSAGTTNGNFSVSGVLTNGAWQQVDATIDASGNVNLYVNGAHVGSQTAVPAMRAVTRSNDYIGRWVNASPSLQYTGGIGDVAISPNVWSAATIANHNAAASRPNDYGVIRVQGPAAQPVCDSRLGLENWWTYVTKPVGDTSTAKVNVSNGNLVVEATDSTPVTTHGRLADVQRRFYNSEETGALNSTTTGQGGPTALGEGWQLSTGQSDDLTNGLTSGAGLNIPTADTVAHPLALTLIDRDGTHHVFDPNALTATSPYGVLGTPNTTASAPGVPGLLTSGTLATAFSTLTAALTGGAKSWLCVDQTYTAPAGVHLGLWRYLYFTGPSGATPGCSTALATAPGVSAAELGWVSERPDRLRDEFAPTGQLTDQIDPAGVDQRYVYSESLTPKVSNVVTLLAPGLAAATGDTRIRDVYEPASCSTQVISGSGAYTLPATCRAQQYTYSDTDSSCTKITGAGNLTVCAKDPAGRTTSYGLDGTSLSGSRLTEVQDPDLKTTLYTYGGCGAATANQLCTITDRNGGITHLSYTLATDVNNGFGAAGAGAPPLLTTLTDRRGYATEFQYTNGAGDAIEPRVPGTPACTPTAPCEFQAWTNIDQAGRVGTPYAGTFDGTTPTALVLTQNTWDTASAPCRTDNVVDNDLCSTTTTASETSPVNPPAGYIKTADATTSWLYGPQGETLKQTRTLAGGNLISTWGYREQQVHTDGTTTCTTYTPGPNGTLATAPDNTTAGCVTTLSVNLV